MSLFGLPVSLQIYIYVLVFFMGTCFGSFLDCMAYRIIHNESFLKGRSKCDHCGHPLAFFDLIPIFSFLFHKGKCRYCGKKLSLEFLISEIVSGIVFLTIFLKYGISLQTLEYLLFAIALIGLSFTDLQGFIIPDGFLIFAITIRIIFLVIGENFVSNLITSLIGGFSVTIVLMILVWIMEKIKGRDMMGGGDIKLLFVTGLYLGAIENVLCIFIACIIGIVFAVISQNSRKDQEDTAIFPWGPSIAISCWICLLIGSQFINWYLSLFY